jgi:hypothetical protein
MSKGWLSVTCDTCKARPGEFCRSVMMCDQGCTACVAADRILASGKTFHGGGARELAQQAADADENDTSRWAE